QAFAQHSRSDLQLPAQITKLDAGQRYAFYAEGAANGSFKSLGIMDDDAPAISGLLYPITIAKPDVLQATFDKWMHLQSRSVAFLSKSLGKVYRRLTLI